MATKEQIKRIYTLGAGLGLVESNNKNDMLHELVFGITKKDSVKMLDDKDFKAVETELLSRFKLSHPQHPKHEIKKKAVRSESNPGMATSEQKSLCWRFCYRLKELDPNPKSADAADRLIGAINKVLGITAVKKDPFKWVSQEQASELIEQLKRYVRSAERKNKKSGDARAN